MPGANAPQTVHINMMGRTFAVSGEDPQRVLKAAALVEEKLQEIQNQSNSVASLNLVLLTALNLAHSYLDLQQRCQEIGQRSESLLKLIETRISDPGKAL